MIATMITIEDGGPGQTSSHGVSRRGLLKIGALGAGGMALTNLLRAAARPGQGSSFKSIINIHLEGGPPQMDTFDMKPDGPPEVRGEFRPIRTRVPGTFICELLPRLAGLADKYTLIRSVVGNVDAHNFDTTQLGYPGLRMKSERFLLARRLVEAGVRYVGLNWGGYLGFDTHKNNYPGMRKILPPLDWSLSALLEDLHQRGLERDVLVIAWAEFGRTPRINQDAGRDHWPAVQSALISGGGLKMGGVIGATDRRAAEPTKRPVHVHEILSTAYHHLGIDVDRTQLTDATGRPRYLLDVRNPIRELL